MKSSRIWRVALLAIVLTLAACGGEAAPTQTPVPSNPPTAAPATAPPAADTATTAPPAATNTTGTTSGNTGTTMNGVTLPADAAPADQQVYVTALR